MFKAIKEFFFGKQPQQEPQAPYKIEAAPAPEPQPVKCGCGRSTTGYCVGLHKLSQEEWAVHPDNPTKPEAKVKPANKTRAKPKSPKAPAAKKPRTKKAAAEK